MRRLPIVALLVVAGCTPVTTVDLAGVLAKPTLVEQGTAVRVHLRRDALGVASPAPAKLSPDGRYRDDYQIDGTLAAPFAGDWASVETADGEVVHVPASAILAVTADPSPPATSAP